MNRPTYIQSLDDERLLPFRNLKRTNLTRWSGKMIAEGWRVVERLVQSGLAIDAILVSDRQWARLAPHLPAHLPILVLPHALAQQLVGYSFHAGVLACAIRPKPAALERWRNERGAVLVALPRTTDPDNLGQIVRISAAFGAAGLILGRGCADPYSRRALRVATGHTFNLPIRESEDLTGDLHALQQWGYEVIALERCDRAVPLESFALRTPAVILLGNESSGLDATWLDRADHVLTIPIAAGVDSLNVSVCAGIALYHLTRDSSGGLS